MGLRDVVIVPLVFDCWYDDQSNDYIYEINTPE